MTLIDDVLPEIPPPRNMVTSMSKKPRFRGPLGKQHRKWVEALWQS